jgi:LPXTG-motif cell wall-anchored protein
MKRLTLALLLALALPAAAAAKGPDQVTISGPGISKTITLGGNGETMQTSLGRFSMLGGFFAEAFQEVPDPTLRHAPTKSLGPRYRVHYRVPGPNNESFRLGADLYPYAEGGALTHMKSGQKIFDGRTYGGWFRAGSQLTLMLRQHGFPARARGASGTNAALVAGIAVPGALALAAAGLLYRRRREQA